MRRIVFALLAVIGIAGCSVQPVQGAGQVSTGGSAAAPEAAPPGNLRDTDWRFVEVGGTTVPEGVVATLRLRDGRASGKAGCNAYGASWQVSAEGGARFGEAMSTKMACLQPAGVMQVERGVLDALQRTARLRREGGNLVLLDASGEPLARLAPDGEP